MALQRGGGGLQLSRSRSREDQPDELQLRQQAHKALQATFGERAAASAAAAAAAASHGPPPPAPFPHSLCHRMSCSIPNRL